MLYYVSFCANGILETFLLANNTPIINHGQIHLQNKIFPSIFLFEEDRVLVKSSIPNYSVRDCGADFLQDMPLYDGMFIEANCQDPNLCYQILVQDASLLTLGHRFYYMEDEVWVGSGDQCHIHSMLVNTLAHEQARFQRQGNRVVVSSLETRVGVYVNGRLCVNSRRLSAGDMIWCMGLSIVFMGEYLAVSCQGIITLEEYPPRLAEFQPMEQSPDQLERSPRVSIPLERGVVEIQGPTPKENPSLPVAVTAGPAFVLSMGMLISVGFAAGNILTMGELNELIASGVAAFTFLLGSLLWPSYIASQHKKYLSKHEDKRLEKYSQYTQVKTRELEEKYNRNRKVWNEVLAPEPDKLVKMVEKYQSDNSLWERNPEDPDFLEIRLGLGSHDFEVEVKIPSEIFDMEEDELKEYPQSIAGKYKTLKDVPEMVSIPHEEQIGVFGQSEKVYELLRAIMIEIMSLHNPDTVKLVCLFGEDDKEHFLWAKDLPALWSNDQSIRFMASTPNQAHTILRYLEHRVTDFPNNETYVMLVSNQALLEQKRSGRPFTQPGAIDQVYSIYFEENLSQLPKGCRATIRCNPTYGGLYCKRGEQNWFVKFSQDAADENTIINFQHAMLSVPFKLSQNHEEIVEKLGFLEMFHCGSVEDLKIEKRWLNHRSHQSLSAPLGQTTGEALFSLDIHEEYHGCHGLVVGDSDRDKTTLLQGLMLSMMVCHSPRDFSVLLMEFNNTNFVSAFEGAPHVLGTVRSLPQCRGMMIPLRLEIQRRKRLFRNIAKEYELDSLDINGYQKFYLEGKVSEVITRIAVVVDEFLPLLKEDPKLLEELLHLVKVGQLLGIHLILATATPSIVKDSHFASQFRVCLNLAHPDDMEEMIGMPPLHSLRHAGRCIVQVGQDEVFAEVQTGNCQLTYVKQELFLPQHAQTVDVIDHAGQRIHRLPIKNKQEVTDKTQLEAVLDFMKAVATEHDCGVEPFLYHEIHHATGEVESLPSENEPTDAEDTVNNVDDCSTEETVAYDEDYSTDEAIAYDEDYSTDEAIAYDEDYSTDEAVAYDEVYSTDEAVAYDEDYVAEDDSGYEEEYDPEYATGAAYGNDNYEDEFDAVLDSEHEYDTNYSGESYDSVESQTSTSGVEEQSWTEEALPSEQSWTEEALPQEQSWTEEALPQEQSWTEEALPSEQSWTEEALPQEQSWTEEALPSEQSWTEEALPQEQSWTEEALPQEQSWTEEALPQEQSWTEEALPSEQTWAEEALPQEQSWTEEALPSEQTWAEPVPTTAVAEVYEAPADYSSQFQISQDYAEYVDDSVADFPIPTMPIMEEDHDPLDFPEFGARKPQHEELEQNQGYNPSENQQNYDNLAETAYVSGEVTPSPLSQNFQQPSMPVVVEPEMEEAAFAETGRDAFLNRDNKTSDLQRADLTTIRFEEGLFVGGTQEEVIKNLMLTLAKFSKIDYIFSENSCGKLSNISDNVLWGAEELDRAIEEIREHVWSMKPEKCVILIPSLHKFCDVVTKRSLDRLTRLVKKHFDHVAVITGDTAEHIAPYRNLDFLNVAVKQTQGIITNPLALETLLPYLDQGLIPPAVDVKETDFLYYNEKSWQILYM